MDSEVPPGTKLSLPHPGATAHDTCIDLMYLQAAGGSSCKPFRMTKEKSLLQVLARSRLSIKECANIRLTCRSILVLLYCCGGPGGTVCVLYTIHRYEVPNLEQGNHTSMYQVYSQSIPAYPVYAASTRAQPHHLRVRFARDTSYWLRSSECPKVRHRPEALLYGMHSSTGARSAVLLYECYYLWWHLKIFSDQGDVEDTEQSVVALQI